MRAAWLCIVFLVGCGDTGTIPPAASVSRTSEASVPREISTPDPEIAPADPLTLDDFPLHAEARGWTFLVLHHSATASGSVESIQEAHVLRKDASGKPWRGIGYHFVIGNGQGMDDGAVEPTFRWREQLPGAHAGVDEYNSQGIGICLIGNFENEPPTRAQIASVKELVGLLSREYGIGVDEVIPHRDVKATACPGELFPLEDIRRVCSDSPKLAAVSGQ